MTTRENFSVVLEKQDLWQYLKNANKPIYLYGMGLGAVKILSALKKYNIKPKGIFASDNFMKNKVFEGYHVKRFSDVAKVEKDFIILLAFASFKEPLYSELLEINKNYEMYAPDVPVVCDLYENSGDYNDYELFTNEYFNRNIDKFYEVYSKLSDEKSKDVFSDIINFKISGKIKYLTYNTTSVEEGYNILKLNEKEDYLDLGAYNGDTILDFLKHTNNCYSSIKAFEPDGKNFRKLVNLIEANKLSNVEALNVGVWDEDKTLTFDAKAGRNSRLNDSGQMSVFVRSVDNLYVDKQLSYIKFDVEGAELKALIGAAETIKRCKPKLFLSCYHKNEDIYELTNYVLSLNPNYKVYLRHHKYIPAWETNLYFV